MGSYPIPRYTVCSVVQKISNIYNSCEYSNQLTQENENERMRP
nr:MAG TPA: hypothetical protein [Bacteriophage sp.]